MLIVESLLQLHANSPTTNEKRMFEWAGLNGRKANFIAFFYNAHAQSCSTTFQHTQNAFLLKWIPFLHLKRQVHGTQTQKFDLFLLVQLNIWII